MPLSTETNFSFAPVLVHPAAFGLDADGLQAALRRYNVHSRRYFNPLISDMTAFRHSLGASHLPCAQTVVRNILALPTYAGLALADVHRICDLIAAIHQEAVDARSRAAIPVSIH